MRSAVDLNDRRLRTRLRHAVDVQSRNQSFLTRVSAMANPHFGHLGGNSTTTVGALSGCSPGTDAARTVQRAPSSSRLMTDIPVLRHSFQNRTSGATRAGLWRGPRRAKPKCQIAQPTSRATTIQSSQLMAIGRRRGLPPTALISSVSRINSSGTRSQGRMRRRESMALEDKDEGGGMSAAC